MWISDSGDRRGGGSDRRGGGGGGGKMRSLAALGAVFAWAATLQGLVSPVAGTDDLTALSALYSALGGANWTSNTNWLVGQPCDGT